MSEITEHLTNYLPILLQMVVDYELNHHNAIKRIDRRIWPGCDAAYDTVIVFESPITFFGSRVKYHIDEELSLFVVKKTQAAPLLFYALPTSGYAVAEECDGSLIRTELCDDLRLLYDVEIANGNRLERIDRFASDKADLVLAFSQPLFTDVDGPPRTKNALERFQNTDPRYPQETSYTCAEERQAIAGPNRA